MNPETNKFELLRSDTNQSENPGPTDTATLGLIRKFVQQQQLLRQNGEPVPQHWTQFQVGECVVIKNYTFKVAYIGETAILFEPIGIPDIGVK
jgi:hypothetical protein